MPIQVIDKAVRIIRVVAKLGSANLTKISVETGLPVPTVARIAASLSENGILQRRDGRNFELGIRLLPLAMPLEPIKKSLSVAHPFIEKLSETTRADCGLAVLQGNEAVVVDWCYGPYPPRIIEPYSREVPLHCAFGLVLIAFQPSKWRDGYLRDVKLKKMAAGTVGDRDELIRKIDHIRKTGVYLSIAENVEGAGSLAVPVFDQLSRLLGAMFVTEPLERFGDRQIQRHKVALFDAANRLSAEYRKSGRHASSHSKRFPRT